MTERNCPFCEIAAQPSHERRGAVGKFFYVLRDGFPVTDGHTLIIPNRHVASFFELTADEKSELLGLLDSVKSSLDANHQPDGYNIGINDGVAAGQTVPHLHIHVIPRYLVPGQDPRGGIRWVIPEKADYWSPK